MSAGLSSTKAAALLDDWAGLNVFLNTATEADSKTLMEAETQGKHRESVLIRVYMRYNRMRRRRELEELRKGAK